MLLTCDLYKQVRKNNTKIISQIPQQTSEVSEDKVESFCLTYLIKISKDCTSTDTAWCNKKILATKENKSGF